MRFWENAQGNIITDEQLLASLTSYGSLSAALKAGDVRLVTGGAQEHSCSVTDGTPREGRAHAKLAAYL